MKPKSPFTFQRATDSKGTTEINFVTNKEFNKMSKTYKIPITWQSFQEFEVEAETLEKAILIALKKFMSINDDNYIDDSWEIDGIIYDNYPNEKFNINDITEEL